MTERKNINRGFIKLRVWQDSIDLYIVASFVFSKLPYTHLKVASNSIDAAHSICRNISEGYYRKGINEYLNFLNYSLGSCGEFYTSFYACYKETKINRDDFEKLDELHYKVENQLLKLIESIQKKRKEGDWEDSFIKN